jgi:hypothetical protein
MKIALSGERASAQDEHRGHRGKREGHREEQKIFWGDGPKSGNDLPCPLLKNRRGRFGSFLLYSAFWFTPPNILLSVALSFPLCVHLKTGFLVKVTTAL